MRPNETTTCDFVASVKEALNVFMFLEFSVDLSVQVCRSLTVL
jgi:hypothetical protein